MTPEEQFLITRTFDRMSAMPAVAKDAEAERLISQQFDRMPDAPYRLVQSVLLQQQALDRLSERLQHLEETVATGVLADASNRSTSFLSGYRAPPALPAGAVPAIGATASSEPARPVDDPAPAPPSRGGGFLASALSTASGVAGGMLLTDGLRELFGGHATSSTSESGTFRADEAAARDRLQDEAQDAQADAEEARRQLAEDDAALDEAQDSNEATGGDAGWDYGEA